MTAMHEPLSVVQALDAACNAHDVDAATALFAPNAVVTQTPPADGVGQYRGTEQIRNWLATQLPGFHVDSRDRQANGETVRWTAAMSNDLLRQIGKNQVVIDQAEAVVQAGKIVSFSVRSRAMLE